MEERLMHVGWGREEEDSKPKKSLQSALISRLETNMHWHNGKGILQHYYWDTEEKKRRMRCSEQKRKLLLRIP